MAGHDNYEMDILRQLKSIASSLRGIEKKIESSSSYHQGYEDGARDVDKLYEEKIKEIVDKYEKGDDKNGVSE